MKRMLHRPTVLGPAHELADVDLFATQPTRAVVLGKPGRTLRSAAVGTGEGLHLGQRTLHFAKPSMKRNMSRSSSSAA
jgi:hypothetical protein